MRLPAISNLCQSQPLARGKNIPPTPPIRLVAIMIPLDAIKCDYDTIKCDWDAITDAIWFVYIQFRHIWRPHFILDYGRQRRRPRHLQLCCIVASAPRKSTEKNNSSSSSLLLFSPLYYIVVHLTRFIQCIKIKTGAPCLYRENDLE